MATKCFKYKFCLYKAYFGKGYALTNYVKYLIALFGLSSQDVAITLIDGGAYALLCFIVGWGWYRYKFIEHENEVNNQFNLFMKEVRKDIKNKQKRKV